MFISRIFLKTNSGQSLLEAILAIFIVLMGLTGIITLAWWNLVGGQESESRIIAANLAREGIEVVRAIKDSNWLTCENWDDEQNCTTWDYSDDSDFANDLEARINNDYTAIAVFNPESNQWHLDFTPNDFSHAGTQMYLDKNNGYYLQDSTPPASGNPVSYYRLLWLDEICENGEIAESGFACESLVGNPPKIGIRVKCQVNWDEHGRSHILLTEDWIYNWY